MHTNEPQHNEHLKTGSVLVITAATGELVLSVRVCVTIKSKRLTKMQLNKMASVSLPLLSQGNKEATTKY